MKTIYYCFPEGKHKVLTMSYDDGNIADRRLAGIFDTYGIRASFHLNGGRIGESAACVTASEIKELYKNHEISAHTLTHPSISRCPTDQVAQQLLEDRKVLESIAGYPVRGMSYPNGSYSRDIINMLPGLGIEYARTVKQTDGFEMPESFLEWHPSCHHCRGLMPLADKFIGLNKKQHLYMMYVWGHSYEFDNDGNWGLIEDFCKLLAGREDIWYATNIQIVDYINAVKNMKYSASGALAYNPNAITVWLSVDGETIAVPGGATVYTHG